MVTYTVFVSSFTATPYGLTPTVTVAVTVLVFPSITDTVPLPALATYTVSVFLFTATAPGVMPTGMVVVTAYWVAAKAGIAPPSTANGTTNPKAPISAANRTCHETGCRPEL